MPVHFLVAKKIMQEELRSEKDGDSGEDGEGNERIFASMVVDLGNQVAGGNVERYAARQWQSIGNGTLGTGSQDVKSQYPEQGHQPN